MVFQQIGKANARSLQKRVIARSHDDKTVNGERSQEEAPRFDRARFFDPDKDFPLVTPAGSI
jgi:hypothetical protein